MHRWMSLLTVICVAVACARSEKPPRAAHQQTIVVSRIARAAAPGHKVIFVGLDGADWQLLDRFIADGTMPNLERLVRQSGSGVLLTIQPPLSPLVWTTMMTGVSPIEHGILDFTRIAPDGVREPITSGDRAVPAVWTMASMAGKHVAVFGLWATYPAEEVNGVLVSDRLFSFQDARTRELENTTYPAVREAWARDALAASLRETGYERLAHFIPSLTREKWDALAAAPDPYSHPETALARILVETDIYNRLALSSLRQDRADLTIVYFQGTDAIGHLFAPFAPPRLPEISATDYSAYNGVARRYFAWIDEILGNYAAIATQQGAYLFVASDHGFEWGDARPRHFGGFDAATAGKWHRKEGIYLIAGPGVVPNVRHDGRASVTQVSPTLLAMLGAPAATGIDAAPISPIRSSGGSAVDYRPFYKAAAASNQSTPASSEDIAKLKALGYIGRNEPGTFAPGSGSRTPASYNNEGLILLDEGKPDDAERAFERALQLDPKYASALWNLSRTLSEHRGDAARSDDLLVSALAAGLPDGSDRVVERAIVSRREGALQRSEALLEKAVSVRPEDPKLRLFRGRYRLESHDCSGALGDFVEAQKLDPSNALAFSSAGLAQLCLGDVAGARASFKRSLSIDPHQPEIAGYLRELR